MTVPDYLLGTSQSICNIFIILVHCRLLYITGVIEERPSALILGACDYFGGYGGLMDDVSIDCLMYSPKNSSSERHYRKFYAQCTFTIDIIIYIRVISSYDMQTSYKRQEERLTLRKHFGSTLVFDGVRVVHLYSVSCLIVFMYFA